MNYFNYKNQILHCEEVSLEKVANEVDTPFYLYSNAHIQERFNSYIRGFENRHTAIVCFAIKANSNLAVINSLAKSGAGADIVSGGELFRALKAGIPSNKIVYSGVGKTEKEISDSIDAGILMFNVESEEELVLISKIAQQQGKTAGIAIRVNPDVNPETHPYISTGLKKNKFGLSVEKAEKTYLEAVNMPGLDIIGIDCHIGSQIVDTQPCMDAFLRVRKLLERLEEKGINLKYIDIGGGLGIRYDDETPPVPEDYVQGLIRLADGLSHTIIIEPGRSIVGNAGVLVTKVLYSKHNGTKQFFVVDAAMNDLARPSLYQAYHMIQPVRESDAETVVADIVGPICETGDFIARDREIPELMPKDLIAVMSSGAYGFTMASNYNSRPRVAEVMVNGSQFEVVRRREIIEDLVRNESIPEWN